MCVIMSALYFSRDLLHKNKKKSEKTQKKHTNHQDRDYINFELEKDWKATACQHCASYNKEQKGGQNFYCTLNS